ncbi:DUF3397 domain-containing protein [Lactobacillus kefiranofaciens]|uniref:DUF3397 domain-containing protein n=1 Tax=Lactobacillus kefiranofaciens TaxID=267818 RepID=A0AAX3UF81_9LACO|nr:DUF3397 domain-containing protein [Lactobacillus kefiranofaciens]AEG40541.1 Hypothetical protein WANG_0846 [Lactobacillus kefiranofaciens subsp. kefiranofaciens]KRM22566.1 hypothetical protein FC93_GL001791 [Lactobacillus kefiranofaciens subsp. kefiranofaciens DSM 5016 = JCM 6985]MDF4142251.1 DUF3397 domain-containing protein [Lactobacillus kefiranofaciens]WGO86154.1 DUF3397 domain-containing protein [Lactobacillus kefiranofaciens]WQH36527.1 DUF3397 domain-containing protein [Lactobacillus 
MLYIFLIPVIGLVVAFLINKIFPRAQFRGYDVFPFFFIAACNLITIHMKEPSFFPYGFLIYFILVIIVSLHDAIRNKNISLGKTIRKLWDYLAACSFCWYVGLLIMMFLLN